MLGIRGGGGIKIFRRNFWSHSAEKIRSGESFFVAFNSSIEKVWIGGWTVTRFSVESVCHSSENFRKAGIL